MEKYYLEFDESEENKLSYTPIFNEYVRDTFEFLYHTFVTLVEMEILNCHFFYLFIYFCVISD